MIRPTTWPLCLLLAVGGCGGTPGQPSRSRPDWSGASIEGIAPLMSPEEVEAALRQRGYRQTGCATDDPLPVNPLYQGDAMPCYESPDRPLRIYLTFLDMKEGRRLVAADFSDPAVPRSGKDQNLARSRAFAQELERRFGKPAEISRTAAFTAYIWRRPGGNATLPDSVRTSVAPAFGANASMISHWAYGEARAPAGTVR